MKSHFRYKASDGGQSVIYYFAKHLHPICTVAQTSVPCQENTEPEDEASYNGAAGDPLRP